GALLRRAAREHPGHGLYFADSDTTLNYPELLASALRLHAGLYARGARPGRVAALAVDRPEDFLPVLWACLLGGLTVCPLPPGADVTRLRAVLDEPLLVTDGSRPVPAGVDAVELSTLDEAPDAPLPEPGPEDLALLVLTSGSTGTPKAVRLTHGNLLAAMRAKTAATGAHAGDTTLNWVSYDHVAALLECHLLPVATGATQVHVHPDLVLTDPVQFLRLLDTHRVTATFTPNFLLGLLTRSALPERLDLSCLRRIVSGGEANPVRTGLAFLDLLAPHGLARTALWPAFGMTETCAGSIYNTAFPTADTGAEFASVGRPVPGLEVRIGEDGEVQLRGPVVTAGYHNNPEATAAAHTPDGWFRTGDLGVLHEGRLTLIGRSKDSIIVNGVNHHSHDLEAVLAQLSGVDPAHVAAFPVRAPGEDTEQLAIAFATTVPDTAEDELHRLLLAIRGAAVTHWGFRPSVLLPLPTTAFAKTSLGKIQRNLLRRQVETGVHAARQAWVRALLTRGLGAHTPPKGPTETAVAEIFAELFPSTSASATASFFDLGGTSLDILRLKRLLTTRLGAELPVLAILRSPTVRELAGLIERPGSEGGYDPVVPMQTTGPHTPLFCVHPGVGEVLVFVNLARYLVHERPFYALRARGFGPGEAPFASFAEMTSTYLAAVRRVQPHGPYALAGYSFGAAVAFELAKLLEADGEEVAFLGSFNLPPHIQHRLRELDFTETSVNLALFLGLVTEAQAEALPERLRPLTHDRQLAELLDTAPAHRLTELDLDLPRFRDWAELATALTGLGRDYTPTGEVRSMTVLCADPLRGTRADWVDKELRRWDEHTREPNRYLDVPGEHYTLMGPDHVDAFQAILRAELARALGED
ncbi:non-ribosomal peptide synthetase, partial [Crossiella equi]